ncbi:orotate phosphoribosyltransferase [Oenococcus oeni IOEB_0205]|uniref:orotate phosphoribosyltransferase n=1 Tax=Oenococcus oeni TaxID=1247 RepID=UPI0004ABEF61|nr:orotate phosphoribosyltransferase [Oenococcus oeni]KEP86671.1 orotate phosphoribosyltransferase [Oenococcus oeni IOEB_0205]
MEINYSKKVANDLLDILAVKFSPKDPFTWASGIISPIYTDNRMTIAYPTIRKNIADGLSELIISNYPDVEIIGGVATAGIPHAAFVSDRMNKPMIYVRSKAKDHGSKHQIEGAQVDNKKLVLIDDLISTGGSVLAAARTVQEAGANVLGIVSIFSYELSAAEKNFSAAGLSFKSLTTYSQLIEAAIDRGELKETEIETLREWQKDQNSWRS